MAITSNILLGTSDSPECYCSHAIRQRHMPVRVWVCSDVNASTASPRVADADDDADDQSIDVKPDEDHHSDDEQSDADGPRSSASRDTDVQSVQSVIVVSAGDDDANDHWSDVQPDDDKESDVEPDDADEPRISASGETNVQSAPSDSPTVALDHGGEMKLCSRLFVLYCRSRPKDDKSRHFDPHFEEVRGGVEPRWMARWKARAQFFAKLLIIQEQMQKSVIQTGVVVR